MMEAGVFEVNYEGTICAAKEVHAILLQYAQGDDLQNIIDDFLKSGVRCVTHVSFSFKVA